LNHLDGARCVFFFQDYIELMQSVDLTSIKSRGDVDKILAHTIQVRTAHNMLTHESHVTHRRCAVSPASLSFSLSSPSAVDN
jgi:hypothetical protein